MRLHRPARIVMSHISPMSLVLILVTCPPVHGDPSIVETEPPLMTIDQDSIFVLFDFEDVYEMTLSDSSGNHVYHEFDTDDVRRILWSIRNSEPAVATLPASADFVSLVISLIDWRYCVIKISNGRLHAGPGAKSRESDLGFRNTELLGFLQRGYSPVPALLVESYRASWKIDHRREQVEWDRQKAKWSVSPIFPGSFESSMRVQAQETDLSVWVSAWEEVIPGFCVDSLSLVDTVRVFRPRTHERSGGGWRSFDPHFDHSPARRLGMAYSPDGRWGVDFHGVQFMRDEERGAWVPAWDIDSHVTLFDFEEQRSLRLLQCGTACGFQQAVWTDSVSFVVTGWTEAHIQPHDFDRVSAVLYFYDLVEMIRVTAVGPITSRQAVLNTVRPRLNAWRRAEFPEIEW